MMESAPSEIIQSPQNEILHASESVYWQEGLGRAGNLKASIESYRKDNSIHWKEICESPVWIRPNMADPEHPNSCTNSQTLEIVLGELVQGGAKEIVVGDIPSQPYLELINKSGKTVESAFDDLGYSEKIKKLREANPDVTISTFDPQNLEREQIIGGMAEIVKPPPEVGTIINLVLPKEHGQYHFTCGTKSFVGLLAPESRNIIHDHGSNEEVTEIMQVNIQKERAKSKSAISREEYTNIVLSSYVEAANNKDEQNATIMSSVIGKASESLSRNGVRVLTIADGSTLMTEHEHAGHQNNLNLAAVSENPLTLDLLVAKRIGLDGEIPYLNHMRKVYKVNPRLVGEIGKDMGVRKISRKMIDIKFNSEGTSFTYKYGLESEIPTDGFEAVVAKEEKAKNPEPDEANLRNLGQLETLVSRVEYIINTFDAIAPECNRDEYSFLLNWATVLDKANNTNREKLRLLTERFNWKKISEMRKINLKWVNGGKMPVFISGGTRETDEYTDHQKFLAKYGDKLDEVRKVQSTIEGGARTVFNERDYVLNELNRQRLFGLAGKYLQRISY